MFSEEFEETSSHKLRHERDMQFSFSYFQLQSTFHGTLDRRKTEI